MIFMSSLLLLFSVPIFFLFHHKKYNGYNGRLPPGSFGLPVIGQRIGLLKAMKADRFDKWFEKRITTHGPISKASIFGYPTVVLHGPTANKFIYTCDRNLLTNTQPPTISRILGTKGIMELSGDDHRRVRAALVSFLKLEVLKQHVAKVDEEIKHHLQTHWHGKHEVQAQPLMKTLTFNIICSLLFGIERGPKREKLLPLFQDMMEAVLSIPINFPFTKYNRGITARKKLLPMLIQLIHEKKDALKEQNQQGDPHKDLITLLLSIICDNDGATMISEDEIVDNIIILMIAGYDTTSVLLTFFVRLLANDESIYSNILREQQELSITKTSEDALTWEDLTKMKYKWRVATEIMRINTPVPMSFRRTKQDIEYEGFIIPKGWQVLLFAGMTHMDDSIFHNPTMFDPTRFEKHTAPPPFSYVAFGAGPRMCPGIEFAKMETLAMMHHLVTRFSWEQLKKDESFKRVPLPKFDQGLLVRVKPLKETNKVVI